MGVLTAYMPVYHMCSDHGDRARVRGDCESACKCWELNPGPLEEQSVLITSKPFLQPQTYFSYNLQCKLLTCIKYLYVQDFRASTKVVKFIVNTYLCSINYLCSTCFYVSCKTCMHLNILCQHLSYGICLSHLHRAQEFTSLVRSQELLMLTV